MDPIPNISEPLTTQQGGTSPRWWSWWREVGTAAIQSSSGSLITSSTSVNANYSVLPGDFAIYCTTGAGNLIVALPAATGNGRLLMIKKVDAGVGHVIVTPNGTDTVEGDPSESIVSRNSNMLLHDGAVGAWFVIARMLTMTG